MLHIDAAFLQSHRLLQIADAPDAFLVLRPPLIVTSSTCVFLIPRIFLREGGHAEHIVVRVHRIVGNIALDQFDHSPADKIFICHPFQRRKRSADGG